MYIINVDGNHWAMIAVTNRSFRVYGPEWYDSYRKEGTKYLNCLTKMYNKLLPDARNEYAKYGLERHGNPIHHQPFVFPEIRVRDPPRQTDHYNCGVFMCANLFYCVMLGLPTDTFRSEDMDVRFRNHMKLSILQNKLQNLITYPPDKYLITMSRDR